MALTGGDIALERSHDGRVANLTLSRPGTYNVVTMAMRRRMAERFAEIDADETVRVVVIRGEGEHFTSGGDIAGFM
ncbi:MAG TPA: enoyl-CoA hydratase/isomerase family protein, partial [Acidimicrobiales bacterium]|nr:enoyl-CoA hydratase/isomerase family protein [Acidimicrobiales bacterium]